MIHRWVRDRNGVRGGLWGGLLVLGWFLLVGCRAGTPGLCGDALPPLRVGVAPTAAPMIFRSAGTYRGIEADFARQLGEHLGRPVSFVRVPFPQLIASLEAGRIDVIMSGMSITGERQTRVAFTRPFMTAGQIPMIRLSDQFRLAGYEALMRMQEPIGVERGSTGDLLASTRFAHGRVVRYRGIDQAAAALRAGRVGVVIHDAPVIGFYLREHPAASAETALLAPSLQLTFEEYAWAVRREDTQLLNRLNGALSVWRADGTLVEILARWLP